jgi:hypothetical protein
MLTLLQVPLYACKETNLMHYLSPVYSVTVHLHVSGLLVAHHQEVAMYICDNWYVLYVLFDCLSKPADSRLNVQHVPIVTYIHCYLLVMGK